MIYRVYVEKKHEVDNESRALLGEINGILGISSVTGVRVLNRYDVEHIAKELFASCVTTVFSEPQTDDVYFAQPAHEGVVFAVEYLPGQFDQRADSAAQCVQMIAQCERPTVRSARVYLIEGNVSAEDVAAINKKR